MATMPRELPGRSTGCRTTSTDGRPPVGPLVVEHDRRGRQLAGDERTDDGRHARGLDRLEQGLEALADELLASPPDQLAGTPVASSMTWLAGSKTTIASTTESRSSTESIGAQGRIDVVARPDPAGQPAVVVPARDGAQVEPAVLTVGASQADLGVDGPLVPPQPRPSPPRGRPPRRDGMRGRRSATCHVPVPAPCTRPSGRWRRGRDPRRRSARR